MSQPAVFRATVQSYRSAASRGMFQIVLEVPEEQTPEVTTIAPRGSWVAVAALAPEGAAPATSGQEREVSAPPAPLQPSDKPVRRRWSDLPLSQQAAIRCGEKSFERFLAERFGVHGITPEDFVRAYCKVNTRSDILQGSKAGDIWLRLDASFEWWLRGAEDGAPAS